MGRTKRLLGHRFRGLKINSAVRINSLDAPLGNSNSNLTSKRNRKGGSPDNDVPLSIQFMRDLLVCESQERAKGLWRKKGEEEEWLFFFYSFFIGSRRKFAARYQFAFSLPDFPLVRWQEEKKCRSRVGSS